MHNLGYSSKTSGQDGEQKSRDFTISQNKSDDHRGWKWVWLTITMSHIRFITTFLAKTHMLMT